MQSKPNWLSEWQEASSEWQDTINEWKGTINEWKSVVDQRKDALIESGIDNESEITLVAEDSELYIEGYITYIAKEKDNLYSIAQKFKVNLKDLLKINNFNEKTKIKEGQFIKLPSKIYIVQKGEGIFALVRKSGLNPNDDEELKMWLEGNDLSKTDTIYPGQKVLLLKQISATTNEQKDVKKDKDEVFKDELGHYYLEDGTYIKSGKKANNNGKVYISPVSSSNVYNFNFLQLRGTPINHLDFLQLCAVAYNEEGDPMAQKVITGVVMNRLQKGNSWGNNLAEVLGKLAGSNVGTTHSARLDANLDAKGIFGRYRIFFNTNILDRKNNAQMKTATQAVIYNLLGNTDYSNGALFWHGVDFFTPNRKLKDGSIENNFAYSNEYIPKGFKWADDGVYMGVYDNKKNAEWEKKGDTTKGYYYVGVATHGYTIYMIINE